jgi:hypothetical protein
MGISRSRHLIPIKRLGGIDVLIHEVAEPGLQLLDLL